jgi:hypothetical protein
MVFGARVLLLLFGFVVLLTQYQNCTSSSQNTMFSSNLSSTAATADPSKVSFSIKNVQSDLFLSGYDDHVQLGGSCNTGGRNLNFFEYSLTPTDGQGTSNLNQNGAKSLKDSRCEDGRFYLVVPVLCPKQGGPNIAGPAQAVVKATLYAFDSLDANGNMINMQKIDQSIFIDLSPQQGCN